MLDSAPASTPFTPTQAGALEQLANLLSAGRHCVVLTGAGVSTESGIPDYRDRDGLWKRAAPMSFQEFVGSHAARQRYWARALVGWRMFNDVEPNRAHRAIATLQHVGPVRTVITQNVDGLHQRAGSCNVIDLHGRIDTVTCLQCRQSAPRHEMQAHLAALNPDWNALHAPMAPDGDAVLEHVDFSAFDVPTCTNCGGVLKPAVVFFGENVPRQWVADAYEAVRAADLLLVAGSSLMVMSGHRFVREATSLGIPVAIVNLGRTRADNDANVKVEARCGEALQWLVDRIVVPLA